ncbi:MAG: NAD(P)/FAD-dependent oxidoreductase [Candidatus Aminicenantales bacterium]
MYDAAVIGGGPSGLQTARLLAEGGARVVVLEKKEEIGRDIVCTGFVGREVFSEFRLPTEIIGPEFQEAKIVSSAGRTIHYRHPAPFAAIVDRRRFDGLLAGLAKKAGAEIETGTMVREIEISRDGLTIEAVSDGRPVRRRARLAVLATGIDRRLHAKMGLIPPQRIVHGAQVEIRDMEPAMPTIYVGPPTAPGGFAWSVPAGEGRVRVGLITEAHPQKVFEDFLARHYPRLDLTGAGRRLEFKPISQGMAKTTVGNRVLAVGEAAGQVKTTTGGGIYYGLWGAGLAAKVVLDALKRDSLDAASLSPYERRWKAGLRREISVGFYARKIYSWMSEGQFETLFALAQSDGIIPLIQREGRFDWQSGVILSLFRKTAVAEIFRGISRKTILLDRLSN